MSSIKRSPSRTLLFAWLLMSGCLFDEGGLPELPGAAADDNGDRTGASRTAPAATSVCLNHDGALPNIPDGTDLGFRYRSVEGSVRGRCVDTNGTEGWNPGCIGVCGDLRDWSLDGFRFDFWNVIGANFTGASLVGTRWGDSTRGAAAQGAIFDGADLRHAWMQGARLTGASFRWADMRKVVFSSTSAAYTDLRSADLREVWWAESTFRFADFRGADLSSPWNFLLMNNCFAPTYCLMWAMFDDATVLPYSKETMTDGYRLIEVPPGGADYAFYQDVPRVGEATSPVTRGVDVTRPGKVAGGHVTVNLWQGSGATITLTHRDFQGTVLGSQVLSPAGDSRGRALLLTDFDGHDLAGRWELSLSGGSGMLLGWSLHLAHAAEDATVQVRVRCQQGHTEWGQSVYAVGSVPGLGSWDPAAAVRLRPDAYPTWQGTIPLPASTTIEWKCIKRDEVDPGARLAWQPGPNNVLQTPASGSISVSASF